MMTVPSHPSLHTLTAHLPSHDTRIHAACVCIAPNGITLLEVSIEGLLFFTYNIITTKIAIRPLMIRSSRLHATDKDAVQLSP